MPHLKSSLFLMPEEAQRLCGLGLCVEAMNNSDILMLRDTITIEHVLAALNDPKYKRVVTTCVARQKELEEVRDTKAEKPEKPQAEEPTEVKRRGRPKGSKNSYKSKRKKKA